MICLDQYRSKLLTETNSNLRKIADAVDEESIHRFRVGIKRLTALYRFLQQVDPGIDARQLLRSARKLSRSISKVRDVHITLNLLVELDPLDTEAKQPAQRLLQQRIRRDYLSFQKLLGSGIQIPLRIPTLRALGLTESIILRRKPEILAQLRSDITADPERHDAEHWHDRRILLKRYHHTLEAFSRCPGHSLDEKEIMKMKMLEQLLGDWHDRVVAVEILQSGEQLQAAAENSIATLKKQERLLLGAARIYLAKFAARKADH